MSVAPVEAIPTDSEDGKPEAGSALCLSGGGYRAMVFHIGVLWRLYETGLLGKLKRISSVSGGSITAGLLGLKWRELSFQPANLRVDFVPKVVEPLRAFAGETIDADDTILVSDAGGKTAAEEEPKTDWPRHSYRVLNLIDNQVRALRKRQVIASFELNQTKPGDFDARKGAYWGIRTDIAAYGLPDALPCPLARTTELAETPTRLKRLDDATQDRLINWGYAVCDAALRKHLDGGLQPKAAFPYPKSGV